MLARAGWRWVTVVALAAVCGAAAAQSNLLFLKSSPVSRFNDEDFRLMMDAGKAVLDSEEPQAALNWRNDKTRNSGRVAVVQRFDFESRACRRLRIDTRAAGMQATTYLSACRDGAGTWAVEPRARAPAAR